jgi:hypothetical protein
MMVVAEVMVTTEPKVIYRRQTTMEVNLPHNPVMSEERGIKQHLSLD